MPHQTYRPFSISQQEFAAQRALALAFDQAVAAFGAARLAAALSWPARCTTST